MARSCLRLIRCGGGNLSAWRDSQYRIRRHALDLKLIESVMESIPMRYLQGVVLYSRHVQCPSSIRHAVFSTRIQYAA